MKCEDRAQNPAPASDFNRSSKPATSDASMCEQCGGTLYRGYRFCSYRCYADWRRGRRIKRTAPSPEEMQAEMHAALDQLQALVLDSEEVNG